MLEVKLAVSKVSENRLLNVGESLNVNFTSPLVVVEIDKLVEEAINLYKLEIEVVAVTPFIFVVSTDPFSSKEDMLELIIEEVDTSPFTIEVSSFTTELSWFWFMNFAVVVDTTPFIFDANTNELVEVETVSVLLLIIVEVDTDPPILEVITFATEDRILGTDRLVTERLVVVAEVTVAFNEFRSVMFAIKISEVDA